LSCMEPPRSDLLCNGIPKLPAIAAATTPIHMILLMIVPLCFIEYFQRGGSYASDESMTASA
jgi:hypothetical protein